MVLSNITDVTLTFSMDGTNDHFVLPSKGFLVLDLTSNKTSDSGLFFKQGTIIYVKQTAGGPAEGSAYASIVFGE